MLLHRSVVLLEHLIYALELCPRQRLLVFPLNVVSCKISHGNYLFSEYSVDFRGNFVSDRLLLLRLQSVQNLVMAMTKEVLIKVNDSLEKATNLLCD